MRTCLAVIFVLFLFSTVAAELPEKRVEVENYAQIDELFHELNYTPEAWQAGIREVPRLYITHIPKRWRESVSKEITVQNKKRVFFRALAPLALRSNELILEDRNQLIDVAGRLENGTKISVAEGRWLHELAYAYGAVDTETSPVDARVIELLLERVDVIPVSLALSQSAEESGWGTSRFANLGNALFGQWTFGGGGIKPEQQRKGMGDYGIKAFEAPLQSVIDYMHNLNTHRAYADLRARRAEMRRENLPVTGWELAETLVNYSERGADYVKSLHAIMRVNKLQPADEAYLGDGPPIHLVPVGEGSD